MSCKKDVLLMTFSLWYKTHTCRDTLHLIPDHMALWWVRPPIITNGIFTTAGVLLLSLLIGHQWMPAASCSRKWFFFKACCCKEICEGLCGGQSGWGAELWRETLSVFHLHHREAGKRTLGLDPVSLQLTFPRSRQSCSEICSERPPVFWR